MAALPLFGAQAAVPPADPQMTETRVVEDGVQLAQYGDVEIYYDEFGRRIIRDAYTGEIIAVERPRRYERRQPRQDVRRGGGDRYYLDDPEDMERLRREKLRDAGIFPDTPRYEQRQPRGYDYQYDDYARGEAPGAYEEYPPAPGGADGDPGFAAREPVPGQAPGQIERRSLDAPTAAAPATGTPEVNAPLAEAPAPGVPNITEGGSIDPSLRLGAREDVAALQILLDRRGASPGVIDGRFGSNVDKAIVAYRRITGDNLRSTDTEGIKKALAETGGDAFTSYTITSEDAAAHFIASVPTDYGEKAKLEKMSYTSVTEMLAERFHMDEGYLKALNPEANFNRVGTIVRVANVGRPLTGPVTRIVADKSQKQVFAYDASNKLVAAYPATIGSTDTPSPTGTHAVSRVVLDPDYTYNPNINFKQGENNRILTIPPGPNGPVGNVWIALDKPTYGIHGTPDPSKIGKTESHGCVRLTNWDAQELAKMVKPGVPVEFVE